MGDEGVADASCAGEASAALAAGAAETGVALSGSEDADDVGAGLGADCVVAGDGCCIAGGTGVEGRDTETSGGGAAGAGCNCGAAAVDATATGEPGREVSSASVGARAMARSSVLRGSAAGRSSPVFGACAAVIAGPARAASRVRSPTSPRSTRVAITVGSDPAVAVPPDALSARMDTGPVRALAGTTRGAR